MTNPYALICWEAQFGDFMNTTQVLSTCAIDKWPFCNFWAEIQSIGIFPVCTCPVDEDLSTFVTTKIVEKQTIYLK